MPDNASSGDKAARLLVGAYVVTIGMAVLIVALSIMILGGPHSCSAMTRAMLVLWATLAALFLGSIVVVGIVASKVFEKARRRRAIVIVYGVMMLGSFVCIGLGLLVAFNC